MDLDDSNFNWAAQAPSAHDVTEFVKLHKLMWPKWDWAAVVDCGKVSREKGQPVPEALAEAEGRLRIAEGIIQRAWIEAGYLVRSA